MNLYWQLSIARQHINRELDGKPSVRFLMSCDSSFISYYGFIFEMSSILCEYIFFFPKRQPCIQYLSCHVTL